MEKMHNILLDFCREVHAFMGDSFKKMIVYGSYARGDYRENSDIDIMIMTNLSENEIKQIENAVYDIAFNYEMDYLIDLSVIIKNEEQFSYWLGALPFYDNVNREGIEIYG